MYLYCCIIQIMDKAILHMDNGYKIPNLRGRGVVCKTYLPSYTAFRGFGGPQGLTVMESVLHEVAVRCGLPPEKVRGPWDAVLGFCFIKRGFDKRKISY